MSHTTIDGISIDTEKLVEEADAIIGHVEAMKTWLGSIKSYYESIHQTWSSTAGDLLITKETDILKKIEETLNSYSSLTLFMQQVSAEYSSAESKIKKSGSSFED